MAAKLYSMSLSHPSQAARLMLERKGIDHDVVEILPGLQPVRVRAAGFRGPTVPALKIDGRRIQGSLEIARTLEELQPEPPLYPSDPGRRRAVEEAERWGEAVLQPVPRRIFRWGTVHGTEIRRWIAADVVGMPLPGLAARANAPVAWAMARQADVSDDAIRRDVETLPALLDHVDELIGERTIGGGEPNAADFQIATTVRVFLGYEDLRSLVEGRPCAELAMRILPEYPGPVPAFVPRDWIPAAVTA